MAAIGKYINGGNHGGSSIDKAKKISMAAINHGAQRNKRKSSAASAISGINKSVSMGWQTSKQRQHVKKRRRHQSAAWRHEEIRHGGWRKWRISIIIESA